MLQKPVQSCYFRHLVGTPPLVCKGGQVARLGSPLSPQVERLVISVAAVIFVHAVICAAAAKSKATSLKLVREATG
jgi:hypothetical protein